MTNNLPAIFNYGSNEVRVIRDENGELWFVAADVCRVLGISNVGNALSRLDDDEKRDIRLTDVMGRLQETATVNEPGLYALILGSRKPAAKAFKRWITHDVLPTLRKTGQYAVKPVSAADLILLQAQQLVDHERRLAEAEMRIAEVVARQAVLERDADYADLSVVDLNTRQLVLLADLLTYAEQLLFLDVPHDHIKDQLRKRVEERRRTKRRPAIRGS